MGFLAPERLARIVSGCMAQPSMHESLNHTMDTMSHSTIINPSTVFTTEPGHSQIIQATVWKLIYYHPGYHLEEMMMMMQSQQLIRLYLTPQLSILLSFFTTESGTFQQIQATALENDAGSHLEDEDTAASFNIFSNSITRNPSVVPANNIKHHAPSGT